MSKNQKNQRAFTLIELLVVVAVIGFLATISFAMFDSTRRKARDAQRMHSLKELQKAVELYYDKNGQYPQPCRGWGKWSGHSPIYGNCNTTYITGISAYLNPLPIDPKWDEADYGYLYNSNKTDYIIISHNAMENVCDGSDADSTPDPGDECNPIHIRQVDRVSYEQATIAVYSSGGKTW